MVAVNLATQTQKSNLVRQLQNQSRQKYHTNPMNLLIQDLLFSRILVEPPLDPTEFIIQEYFFQAINH